MWNGNAGYGETEFINQSGTGSGGFYFYSLSGNENTQVDFKKPITTISATGTVSASTVTTTGNITANGNITSQGNLNVDGFMNGVINNPGFTFLPMNISGNFGSTWLLQSTSIPADEIWSSLAISASGQYQTAVSGTTGNIYCSTNYGASWSLKKEVASYPAVCIAMSASGQYQTAAYKTGSVYKSNDYGSSWGLVIILKDVPLTSVAMSASGQYQTATINVWHDMYIFYPPYFSNDYGSNWSPSKFTGEAWGVLDVAMSASGQYQTAAGKYTTDICTILISSDYGASWTDIYAGSNFPKTFYSVAVSASGQYQTAVYSDGSVYISSNYGYSLTKIPVNTTGLTISTGINTIAISASGQYQTAVYCSGFIFYSIDYGNTWSQKTAPASNFSSIAMSASGQYQIATNGSNLYTAVIPISSINVTGGPVTASSVSAVYGAPKNVPVNSSTIMWNGGLNDEINDGETDFINQYGLGTGGFKFYSFGGETGTVDFKKPITTISAAGEITASSFLGNATSATSATNIAAGSTGAIPYQTGANTTSFIASGVAGQILTSQGGDVAPTWVDAAPTPSLSQVLAAGNNGNNIGIYNAGYISTSYGATQTVPVNSSTIMWNGANAQNDTVSNGETNFINQHGSGSGGFYFYTVSGENTQVDFTKPITRISAAGEITASSFLGNATSATNIAAGSTGAIPYQTGANTTSFINAGAAGQILSSQGQGNTPAWINSPNLSQVLAAGNDAGTIGISNASFISTGFGAPTTVSANSTTIMWNGDKDYGVTEFINQSGNGGGGGFNFYSLSGGNTNVDFSNPITRIDPNGTVTATSFTTTGNISALNGSVSALTISSTGNISANGNISATGNIGATGNISASGVVNATSFTATSDYRIKQDVRSLDETFVVDDLNPVTYINTKTGKQDIGLIAHELQEIYPCLVTGVKDGEETQTINYTGLIGVLINEIKGFKNEIKGLKNELFQLKQQINK
jgi:hypothetical protein